VPVFPLSAVHTEMLPASASTCVQRPLTHVATCVRLLFALPSTSRPYSIAESVAAAPCCHVTSARYSLGLRSPSGCSPRPRCLWLDTLARLQGAPSTAAQTGLSLAFAPFITDVEDIQP
jgi:hypothetical protein